MPQLQKRTLSFAIATGLLLLPTGINSAFAGPLVDSGGPVLDHFTIHALYWGKWTKAERDAEQDYLRNLAAYMSGDKAPDGEVPTIRQYGVEKVTLDEHQFTADTDESCDKPIKGCGMKHPDLAGPIGGPLLHSSIIYKAQHRSDDPLPGFGPHTLIAVLLPHHYVLTDCKPYKCGGAYHSSESKTEYWTAIPEDQGQQVIAHEVQEASANPAIDNAPGWPEVADPCDGTPGITLRQLGGIQIAEIADNTRGGACNPTGYIAASIEPGGSSSMPTCTAPYSWDPAQHRCAVQTHKTYDQAPPQKLP